MANTKNTWQTEAIIRHGYIEYPLPEGIERKITSGKWGTAIVGNTNSTTRKPASKKKK